MIQADSIEVLLGRRAVLAGVSLEVAPGEVLALFGPNGAGKSTLLRVLAGLQAPARGSVWIAGRQVVGGPPGARAPIGYLGHASLAYPWLTGEENLRFYGALYGLRGPELRRRAADLLERVGLQWNAADPVRTYSRGMLQRLAIARAWIGRPAALLLDEPHTGLDPDGVARFESLLREAKTAGCAAVMVSHDAGAARVADRSARLEGGLLRVRPA